MMPNYDSGNLGETREENIVTSNPITINRVLNMVLVGLFIIAIGFHVACLAVLAAKHNELVDKFAEDIPEIKELCILFIDHDRLNGSLNWVNNRCDMVIYGSGTLGVCALLMIVILIIRTLLFTKINGFVVLDGMEIVLTGLFAGALALMVTLGKNETCRSIERATADVGHRTSCEDFYFFDYYNNRKAQIYDALRTAQVTSWIAAGVIGVISILTLIRGLLWIIGVQRNHQGSATLSHPLVEHDQLDGHNNLRNVLSSSSDDDI